MRLRPEAWRAKAVAPAILLPVGVRRRKGRRERPPALLVDGFPGNVCISVSDEAIHGIPGKRALCEGDLVGGLTRAAENAFRQATKVARAGSRVYDIGRAVEREVKSCDFRVLREVCGHGVGRSIVDAEPHEEPSVPNYTDAHK
jgi:methionyl aminopeptidase